jgi:hypothetical protein
LPRVVNHEVYQTRDNPGYYLLKPRLTYCGYTISIRSCGKELPGLMEALEVGISIISTTLAMYMRCEEPHNGRLLLVPRSATSALPMKGEHEQRPQCGNGGLGPSWVRAAALEEGSDHRFVAKICES